MTFKELKAHAAAQNVKCISDNTLDKACKYLNAYSQLSPLDHVYARPIVTGIMSVWDKWSVKTDIEEDGSTASKDAILNEFNSRVESFMYADEPRLYAIASASFKDIANAENKKITTSTGTEKTTVTPTGTEKRTLAKGAVTTEHYYETSSSQKAYESPTDKVTSANDTDELTFITRKTETNHVIDSTDPMKTISTEKNLGVVSDIEKLSELKGFWAALCEDFSKALVRIISV